MEPAISVGYDGLALLRMGKSPDGSKLEAEMRVDDVFSGLQIGDTVGVLFDVELHSIVVFINRNFVLEADSFGKTANQIPKPGQGVKWYPFVHLLGSCKAISLVKNALPPVISDTESRRS